MECCFLAQFSDRPCDGEAIWRVHLIEKQALRRRGYDPWDPRAYVYACGGRWPGLAGHHGHFDTYRLVVPAEKLPEGVIELCREINFLRYLERRYGWTEACVSSAEVPSQ